MSLTHFKINVSFSRLNRLIKAIQSITQNLQTLVLVLSLALFFYYNCSLTIHADISWEPGVNVPNCVEVVSNTEI